MSTPHRVEPRASKALLTQHGALRLLRFLLFNGVYSSMSLNNPTGSVAWISEALVVVVVMDIRCPVFSL